MELKDLVGKHVLTGVDMDNKSIQQYGDYFEDCEVINFVLDGKTYSAVEDPSDGYRSCMKEIIESVEPIKNTFPGQEILARMRDDSDYGKNEILDCIDVKTGKIVLSVGTESTDDYYPLFIGVFTPENMGINSI